MPLLTKINTNVIADNAVTAAKTAPSAEEESGLGLNSAATGNLTGTISTQQLQLADAFTLTGDLTVNDDLVLGKVRDDGTGQSITGDGKTLTGTGTLTMGGSFEGGEQLGREKSIGSGVTGGSGLNALGTVLSGNIDAISSMVYMGKVVADAQAIVEFKHNVAVTGGTPDFSSSYSAHLFIVENFAPTTNGGQMRCRYSTDLGSNYVSSGYDGFSDHGITSHNTNLQSTDSFRLGTSVKGTGQSGGSEGQSGQCWLYGASVLKTSLLHFDMIWHRDDATAFYSIVGQYWSTANTSSPVDIDALKFYFHSGNITSGTVRMYGLKA